MLDLECALVDSFGWSLSQIEETDIESLFPFFFHYPQWKTRGAGSENKTKHVFADEADWL